jgi:hypothetical protein
MTTLLHAPPAARLDGERPELGTLPVLATATIGLALLAWAVPLTHGAGGRDPWVLALALLALAPALIVNRPWRVLPTWQIVLAVCPALAAIVVCLTAATGWDGLDEVATLAYAGLLCVAVRSWATSQTRRRALLVFLVLVGFEQFSQAYVPWWGSGTVHRLMVGTFYWHNQFSAFMVAAAVLAGVMAVRGTGMLRKAGWFTAPWCMTAVLLAGSRAALATLCVLWVVVIALALLDRRGRMASLAIIAVSIGLATLLTSPLLMEKSGSPFSGLQARAGESVEGNGRARLEFWKVAGELGADHPLTGAGFDSFLGASLRLPAGAGTATQVHNGYLQAFSDGGAPLLLAVALATGVPLLAGLRLIGSAARRREDDVLNIGVPLALLGLILHSGVDFDWIYPSLLAFLAILAGLVGPAERSARTTSRLRTRVAAAVAVALLVVSVPAAIRASGLRFVEAEIPAWAAPATLLVPARGHVSWLPASSVCHEMLAGHDPAELRTALSCTKRAAAEHPGLQMDRARAMVRVGQVHRGVALAGAVAAQHGVQRPALRFQQALVLLEAHRPAAARVILLRLRTLLAKSGTDEARAAVEEALRVLDVTGPGGSSGSQDPTRWKRGANVASTAGEGA